MSTPSETDAHSGLRVPQSAHKSLPASRRRAWHFCAWLLPLCSPSRAWSALAAAARGCCWSSALPVAFWITCGAPRDRSKVKETVTKIAARLELGSPGCPPYHMHAAHLCPRHHGGLRLGLQHDGVGRRNDLKAEALRHVARLPHLTCMNECACARACLYDVQVACTRGEATVDVISPLPPCE